MCKIYIFSFQIINIKIIKSCETYLGIKFNTQHKRNVGVNIRNEQEKKMNIILKINKILNFGLMNILQNERTM